MTHIVDCKNNNNSNNNKNNIDTCQLIKKEKKAKLNIINQKQTTVCNPFSEYKIIILLWLNSHVT